MRWREQLQSRYRNPLFKVPTPTLNLGHIHGGDNPNRICAHCELQIDIRPLPGMDLADLRAEMTQRLHSVLVSSGLTLETLPLFSGIPAFETAPSAPIVQAAERLTGHAAEAVAFGTEAPYLKRLGMDALVLGPGDIEQAHQPDEFLALDRIEPFAQLLRSLIERFCIQPESVDVRS
jgi:acetylornithine deacetylase